MRLFTVTIVRNYLSHGIKQSVSSKVCRLYKNVRNVILYKHSMINRKSYAIISICILKLIATFKLSVLSSRVFITLHFISIFYMIPPQKEGNNYIGLGCNLYAQEHVWNLKSILPEHTL